MGSNNLAIIETNLPLKAYPKDSTVVDDTLKTSFKFWLATLLSIKSDNEDKLDAALPIIKQEFWSLGFVEIKKAFEMYALGKLQTQPISNYIDIILVGKIFKEYRQQKVKKIKVIEPIEISPEEKRNNEILSATICFDYYIQNGYLNETSLYLYKVLKDKFNFKKKEIDKFIEKSKELDKPVEDQRTYYKKLCLRRYFDILHAKGKHIKDII